MKCRNISNLSFWKNIKLFFMAQTDANLSIQKEGGVFFFTFFPTDKVVDERYALKNKVQMKFHK